MIKDPDEFDREFLTCLGRCVARNAYLDGTMKSLHVRQIIRVRCAQWDGWRGAITSPIELRMLAHLLMKGNGHCVTNCDRSPTSRLPDTPNINGVVIHPQFDVGPYVVDFLLKISHGVRCEYVALECDGHDYHERTKEQAAYDRARDRYMTTKNVRVMRFTGSEIFHDVAGCAEQIADLCGTLYENLRKRGRT